MTECRAFARSFDALGDIFAFTAEVFARENTERAMLPGVDLVLEELFTNIVKYGHGASPVDIEITGLAGGVEVTLTDFDADSFDMTRGPAVDIAAPIESRQPGGLGLHLIRKLVDSIEHRYSAADRRSRITFRMTRTTPLVDAGTP